MKIIFLDIDGVLNSMDSIKHNYENGIGPRFTCIPFYKHVECLNKITDETGAVLVISSTWRKLHSIFSLELIFHMCLIHADVFDVTPVMHRHKRGDEIQKWMDERKENIESFVILDDDSDMVHLIPYLVKVDNEHGLTDADAEKTISILNKEV